MTKNTSDKIGRFEAYQRKVRAKQSNISKQKVCEYMVITAVQMISKQTGIKASEIKLGTEQIELINGLSDWIILNGAGEFNPDKSIYIAGPIGVGKTTIARAFAKTTQALKLNFGIDYDFYFADVGSRFNKSIVEGDLRYLNNLTAVRHMVLDEVREDQFTFKHFGNQINFMPILLNARYKAWLNRRTQTVITTNLKPRGLQDNLKDPRLYDRLRQQYHIATLNGPNYRHL